MGRYIERGKRNCKLGQLFRIAEEEIVFDDNDVLCFKWHARGNILDRAEIAADFDTPHFRARRGTGWKNHKYRHQWEHKVIEREKHERNGLKKKRETGAIQTAEINKEGAEIEIDYDDRKLKRVYKVIPYEF